jgi:hypothetical protein
VHFPLTIYISGLLARPQKAWSQYSRNMRVIAHGVNRWPVLKSWKYFAMRQQCCFIIIFVSFNLPRNYSLQSKSITASSPDMSMALYVNGFPPSYNHALELCYTLDVPSILMLLFSIVKLVSWAFLNTCAISSTVLSDKASVVSKESLYNTIMLPCLRENEEWDRLSENEAEISHNVMY